MFEESLAGLLVLAQLDHHLAEIIECNEHPPGRLTHVLKPVVDLEDLLHDARHEHCGIMIISLDLQQSGR